MEEARIKTGVVSTGSDHLERFLRERKARLIDIQLYASAYLFRYAEVNREYEYKLEWRGGTVTFNEAGTQPRIDSLYSKGALNVFVCVHLNKNGSYTSATISEWEDWKHRSDSGE